MVFIDLLQAFLVDTAHAAIDPCLYVAGGCPGQSATESYVNGLISSIGQVFATIAGGLSVLFVLVGGFQMMTAFGDEGNFQKGYKNIITAVIGFGVVLGSQVIVSFVDSYAAGITGGTVTAVGLSVIQKIVTALLGLFNTIFIILLMASGIRMIIARGKSDEFNNAKQGVGFALAGALAINAAYAIARAALNLFG